VDLLEPRLAEGSVVSICGRVEIFREKVQVIVEDATPVAADSDMLLAFLPNSRFPIDEMWSALGQIVASVEDVWVRRFLQSLMEDPEISAGIKRAPAAKVIHHAHIGGLLEHMLSVCRLLDHVAGHYRRYYPDLLDRSLLIAGGILHDLAKIWELSYAGAFGYTDEGKLVGHLVMGCELVDRVVRTMDGFPEMLRLRLRHLVVGHHGKLEYGSPQLPQTPEAIVLHYVDDMDSKVNLLHTAISGAAGQPWTPYIRSLGRSLLNVYNDVTLSPLPDDLPGGPMPASVISSTDPDKPPAGAAQNVAIESDAYRAEPQILRSRGPRPGTKHDRQSASPQLQGGPPSPSAAEIPPGAPSDDRVRSDDAISREEVGSSQGIASELSETAAREGGAGDEPGPPDAGYTPDLFGGS